MKIDTREMTETEVQEHLDRWRERALEAEADLDRCELDNAIKAARVLEAIKGAGEHIEVLYDRVKAIYDDEKDELLTVAHKHMPHLEWKALSSGGIRAQMYYGLNREGIDGLMTIARETGCHYELVIESNEKGGVNIMLAPRA